MTILNDTQIPDQPYPELRDVLNIFVNEIAAELKDNLVGVYLVGSIASGDFDLDSDVDFLVVTQTELTEAALPPLQAIQIKVHAIDCYPAKHLEGSYISLGDLNDLSTVGHKPLFYFDNGSTAYERSTHDNQWHVRWILRERGMALTGPKPETLLPAIPRAALLNEIRQTMLQVRSYFEAEINRPLSFFNCCFGQSFAVLTYCRMLHTLRTGEVQSKKLGVEWARQIVNPRWVGLIDRAWSDRQGARFGGQILQRAEAALLDETLEFIRYAIARMEVVEN